MRSNLNCRKTSINVYFDRNTAQPKRDFFCTAMDMAGTRIMMKNIYWIITQIILDMAYVDGLVQDRWNVTPSLTHWSNICLSCTNPSILITQIIILDTVYVNTDHYFLNIFLRWRFWIYRQLYQPNRCRCRQNVGRTRTQVRFLSKLQCSWYSKHQWDSLIRI